MNEIHRASIEHRFKHHPPKDGKVVQRHEQIRSSAKTFALEVFRLCPESPEAEKALEKAEEALFWANAAIARYGNRGED